MSATLVEESITTDSASRLSDGRQADFRAPRSLRALCGIVGIACGLLSAVATLLLVQPEYKVQTAVLSIEGQARFKKVEFSDRRLQSIASIGRSNSYAAQLQRFSGVDVPVREITEHLESTRPRFGGVVTISFVHHDKRLVERIGPMMLRALATTVHQIEEAAVSGSGQVGSVAVETYDLPGRPLYFEPFVESSAVEVANPPLLVNFLIGSVFGVVAVPMLVLLAHRRTRVDSSNGLSGLLASRGFLHAPQPTFVGARADRRRMRALAEQLLSERGGVVRVVAIAGDGLLGMRRRIAVGLALAMAAAGEEQVTFVDLDEGWRSVRWRRLTGREVRRRHRLRRGVRPWQIPLSLWGEWRAQRASVSTITDPIGPSRRGDELAERIVAARHRTTIVALLPDTPGRWATDEVLQVSDLVVQVVLDGWTVADRASLCRQLLETSAPGRTRVLVVEN